MAAVAATALLLGTTRCSYSDGTTVVIVNSVDIEITDAPRTVSWTPVMLEGRTECEACEGSWGIGGSECPTITCPVGEVQSLTWHNEATGERGAGTVGVGGYCSCTSFSGCTFSCQSRWSAQVPLALGPNPINIQASNVRGETGTASVTITRVPPAP